jgi:cyanophycinase
MHMTQGRPPGPLVIIGGAEDRTDEARILREFVRLAGGPAGRLLVLPCATERAHEVGSEYVDFFRRLGAANVGLLPITQHGQANDGVAVSAVDQADGVFFPGGDQLRITNLLGGTRLDRALHRRHEAGLVLGGTSAGAAMMSSTMIVAGASEATPRAGVVRVGPGLEFLPGVMIDQHFTRRGRTGRLLAALAQYPHQLGVGIDEDTALVVTGTKFRVLGSGAVTVIDVGGVSFSNVMELTGNDHLTICGVQLHILADGFGFDLENRTPLLKGQPEPAGIRKTADHETPRHPDPAGPEHLSPPAGPGKPARPGKPHRQRKH